MSELKVFIWYANDDSKGETMKIYAVAEDLAEARRQVMKALPAQLHGQFAKAEPQSVWSVPFAEVNMSKRGTPPVALAAAEPLGGTMRVNGREVGA